MCIVYIASKACWSLRKRFKSIFLVDHVDDQVLNFYPVDDRVLKLFLLYWDRDEKFLGFV